MLTLWGTRRSSFCDGLSRRDFLKVGALSVGGLAMPELLRAQAGRTARKVIMVYLPGGPSHIDMYDMKPLVGDLGSPFKPGATRVAGLQICDQMPKQAEIADKLAILRGLRMGFNDHANVCEIVTGFPPDTSAGMPKPPGRPAFGSVVSRMLDGKALSVPPYVGLSEVGNASKHETPAYLGGAHRPFAITGPNGGNASLGLAPEVTLDRLEDRKALLRSFDSMRRDLDARGEAASMDRFTARALDLVASGKARDACDLSRAPQADQERYGKGKVPNNNYGYRWIGSRFLLARRLVEAGVPLVTLSAGSWDHHGGVDDIFAELSKLMPPLDLAIHALVTDLHDRGLDKDVAVVIWGEFGRDPKIDRPGSGPAYKHNGRNHWQDASFAVVAGGGLRMGQVVGETDKRGGRSKGPAYTPQNVLATLYRLLAIDPEATLPDHQGRPMYLLDDAKPIKELLL